MLYMATVTILVEAPERIMVFKHLANQVNKALGIDAAQVEKVSEVNRNGFCEECILQIKEA